MLWPNGSEIDIDPLVCPNSRHYSFNKKVENTAKGEQRGVQCVFSSEVFYYPKENLSVEFHDVRPEGHAVLFAT